MRDYQEELKNRIRFLREVLENSGAKGFVYGNSGGKDSVLVGILCSMVTDNVLGVMMPCQSKRNFEEDMQDAMAVAEQYHIDTITVDLSDVKTSICTQMEKAAEITDTAKSNIAPRLRMTTLYAIAQSRGALVAGTGNRSEAYMGYFTKWGDGAYDVNPISDLTVGEIYEFLEFLKAPENIIQKAPSAGLFEGQTDEAEMGVKYSQIDEYILHGTGDEQAIRKITAVHGRTEHKRGLPLVYKRVSD